MIITFIIFNVTHAITLAHQEHSQSGREVFGSGCDDSYYTSGRGYRLSGIFEKNVEFKEPFTSPPDIYVVVIHVDTQDKQNLRITTDARNITESGFVLRYEAWSYTHICQATVGWMTY